MKSRKYKMVLCLSVLYLYTSCFMGEYYHPKWSRICTTFASGFTEANFAQLHNGMTKDSLKILLGTPMYIQTSFYPDDKYKVGTELWYFSQDGGGSDCPGDYAWLGREVLINERGYVVDVRRVIHYD
jgi:hypothetical protein